MKKSSALKVFLAYLLAFAMILPCIPVFSLPAFASGSENRAVVQPDGTITLPNVNNGNPVTATGFKVGWGQGDFTPSQETNTLPCVLGSSETHLVSEVYDHMYATCVALSDASGNTVLLFSVDLKGISDSYDYTRYRYNVLTNSKLAASQAAQELGFNVPVANITFTATHSHNSVHYYGSGAGGAYPEIEATMTRWRNDVYYPAVAEAAREALSDLADTEAYAGHGDTTGVNAVRRYYLEDGSYSGIHTSYRNLNQATNGYLISESLADPDLQTVHFRRANRKDIVMVNWAAHAASGNNETNDAFSSDYVHYMRKEVEEKLGVHFIFFNGASGNVVIGNSAVGADGSVLWREVGKNTLPAIVSALETEDPIDTGEVRVVKANMTATYRNEYTLPGWNPEEGRCYTAEEIQADITAVLANGAFSKTNYPMTTRWGQAMYIRYYPGGQTAVKEAGLLTTYQFQSWYEPFYMVSRASANKWYNDPTYSATEQVPYTAISAGELAFAFAPYEMFDTNGIEVRRDSPFEMTFMCAYADGRYGYIPSAIAWSRENYHARQNRLAVEGGGQALYGFATQGAGYEVNVTRYVPGTGEMGVEFLLGLLNQVADEKVIYTVGSTGTYATVQAALEEALGQTWKMSQVLEIQVLESGAMHIASNLAFDVPTIWRENNSKLPIVIQGGEGITLTPDETAPSSYTIRYFTNDYTFRNITLDLAGRNYYLFAGSGEITFDTVSFGTGSSLRLFGDTRTRNVFEGWTKARFDQETENGLLPTGYTFRNTVYNAPASRAWQAAYIAAAGVVSEFSYQNGDLVIDRSKIHAKITVQDGADLTRVNGHVSDANYKEVGKISILVTGGTVRGICADSGSSVSYHSSRDENFFQATGRNPVVDITVRGGLILGTGDGIAISGITNSKYGESAKIHITVSGGVIYDKVVAVGGHATNTGTNSATDAHWFAGGMESVDGEFIVDIFGGIFAVPEGFSIPEAENMAAKTSPIYGVFVANNYNSHTLYGTVNINSYTTLRNTVIGVHSVSGSQSSTVYQGEIPAGAWGVGATVAENAQVLISHKRGWSSNFSNGIAFEGMTGGVLEGDLKLSFDGGSLGEVYLNGKTGQKRASALAITGDTTVKSTGKVIMEANGGYLFGKFRIAEGSDYTVESGASLETYFNGGCYLGASSDTATSYQAAQNGYGAILQGAGQTTALGLEEGSKIRVELNGTEFSTAWTALFRLFASASVSADIDIVIRDLKLSASRTFYPFSAVNVYGDTNITIDTTVDSWGGSSENAPDRAVTGKGFFPNSSNFYGNGVLRVDGGANKTVTLGKLHGLSAVNAENTVKNATLGEFYAMVGGAILTGTAVNRRVETVTNDFTNVDIRVWDLNPADDVEELSAGMYVGTSTDLSHVHGTVKNSFEHVTAASTVVCGSIKENSSCQNIINTFGKSELSRNEFGERVFAGMSQTGASSGSITNYFAGTNDVTGIFYGTHKSGSVTGNVIHYLGGTPIFRGSDKGFCDNVNACTVSGNVTTELKGSITPETCIKLGVSNSVRGSTSVKMNGGTLEEGATLSGTEGSNVYIKTGTFTFQNGTVKGSLTGPGTYQIYSGSFYVAPLGTYVLAGGTVDWNADATATLRPSQITGNIVLTRTASPYIKDAVMLETAATYQNRVNLDNTRQRGSADIVVSGSVLRVVGQEGLSASAVLQITQRITIKVLVNQAALDAYCVEHGLPATYSFTCDDESILSVSGSFDQMPVKNGYYEIVLPALGAADFRTGLHLVLVESEVFHFTLESIAESGAAMFTGQEKKLFQALVDYGSAACGDTTLLYYDRNAIKSYDIPQGLGGSRGEGNVVFDGKTLLMGDVVGVRLSVSSGDLSGVKVMLNGGFDITDRCVIDEANGTLDFFVNARNYNDVFTVTVYDANGVECITIIDTVKHVALELLEAHPDLPKVKATAFFIQAVLNYRAYKDPAVSPGNGTEVGTVAPIF